MPPSQSRSHPDMWVDPGEDPRQTDAHPAGEHPAGERATLLDYLRSYRLTLQMKCDGLSPEQLAARSVPPSSLSLLGLVRHLAGVEQTWFRLRAAGEPGFRHFRSPEDRDLDFNGAVGTEAAVAEAFAAWRDEIAFAERFVADHPDLGEVYHWDGAEISLRELLVHMIEEYARHCGHADLLRECIDGRTGQ